MSKLIVVVFLVAMVAAAMSLPADVPETEIAPEVGVETPIRLSCQIGGNAACTLSCKAQGFKRGVCGKDKICRCYRS